MKLTISMLCIVVATTTFAGCGGNSGGSPSDTIMDAIATICERAHACRTSYIPAMNGDEPFEEVFSSSVANCITERQALVIALLGADYLEKLDASTGAGRIRYSSVNAETCLDAMRDQTCDQVFEQNGQESGEPAACDSVFVGTVPTGAACTIDADCATSGNDCTNVCG